MMAKAKTDRAKKNISLYLTSLRSITVQLTGDDLKAMGIPPGPRYRRILADLHDAKLDGLVKDREEELAFARERAGIR